MSFEIPDNAGLEGLAGDVALIVSRRELIQPSTKLKDLGLRQGDNHFVDRQAKVLFGPTEVVILKTWRSRLLMPAYGQDGNKPRCFSEDAIRPSNRVQNPMSSTGLCKDCQFKDQDEKINLLCYDVKLSENNGKPEVFSVSLKPSSMGIVSRWLLGLQRQKKRVPDVIVTIGGTPGRSEKANINVLEFTNERPVPQELKDEIGLAYHMYVGADVVPEEGTEGAGSEEAPF